MTLYDIIDIEAILKSTLANFVIFSANDCGYYVSARDLILNWIHLMLLKDNSASRKEYNTN